MRTTIFISILLIGSVLTGCARLTTYNKAIDLDARSVSIDAKQRLIISKEGLGDVRIVCAEPSPDALAVLGASGALTGSNQAGAGGSVSAGFAEAAGTIGLRTQSIQLLRDLNYRICEAYANDAIGRSEASALIRRGQSTMMGLIAIEQLTGPVVASQLALTASINAGTGGASGDVSSAQSAVAEAKESLLTAQAEVDAAKTEHDRSLNAVNDARKKLSSASTAETPDQAVIDSLSGALKEAQDNAKNTENTLKDKRRREISKVEDLKLAQKRLIETERGNLGASGLTGAQLTEITKANAEGNQVLAKEVRGIVSDINFSYLRDGCFSLVTDVVQNPGLLSFTGSNERDVSRVIALEAALKTCTSLLNAEQKSFVQGSK